MYIKSIILYTPRIISTMNMVSGMKSYCKPRRTQIHVTCYGTAIM